MKTLESFFNRPHYLTPQNKRLDASAFSHRLRSKKDADNFLKSLVMQGTSATDT